MGILATPPEQLGLSGLGTSDPTVTIFCPGLSRNAEFDTLPLNQLQVDKVSHVSPFNSDASRSYFILKNFFDWQIK